MKKLLLLLIFGIFFISLTSAALLGTFQVGEDVNLVQTCSDCTYVKITSLQKPDGEIITFNENMQKDGTYYNWTLNGTYVDLNGIYLVNGVGDLVGLPTIWSYDFEITHSGGMLKEGSSGILIVAIIFMLILGGLCLLGFFRKDQHFQTKWTLFIFSFIFFLAGANLISALIGDTLANPRVVSFFDSFMSISFIIFWFAFGILAVIWFLTILQTILFRKKQKQIQKYGELYG